MTAAAKIDGPALREVTVRDYKRAAERAGASVDLAAIEALALADCNTYAAVTRDRKPVAAATPDPAKVAEKEQALDRQVKAETGTKLVDTVGSSLIPQMARRTKPDERFSLAKGRMKQITRGADPLAWTPSTASDEDKYKAITSTCEIPELALALVRLEAHWSLYVILHDAPPSMRAVLGRGLDETNVFEGMAFVDAFKKYQRLIEDICDKSTGRLGPWRTPK